MLHVLLCQFYIVSYMVSLKDGRHNIKGLTYVGDYVDDRGFHLIWKITNISKISGDKGARDLDKRTLVAFHDLSTFIGAIF